MSDKKVKLSDQAKRILLATMGAVKPKRPWLIDDKKGI